MSEPLENINNYRYFIQPDKKNPIYETYLICQELFWVPDEINDALRKDSSNWENIDQKIKNLLIHQIAFFLIGDGIVNQTIANNIEPRITDREVQLWYNFQKMMEDIHNITYVKLADTYVLDPKERKIVFNAVENYPVIKRKTEWLAKWLGNNDFHKLDNETINELKDLENIYQDLEKLSIKIHGNNKISKFKNLFTKLNEPKPLLGKQIYINIIMEGLFFQGSFCILFWFNHTYTGKLPGLAMSNEFISRDEGLHTFVGIKLYNHRIQHRLSQELAHQIMNEAVEIEIDFMSEALPSGLLNMNINLLTEYIKFVADVILIDLKYEKMFFAKNPFTFMEKQSISVRIGDFFMNSLSEYGNSKANTTNDEQELDFSEDF